jgi:glycosyltransferase involved in cell wall biosynthesis
LNIWIVVYERPDKTGTGFGRAVWSLSKVFASKAKVHIIYEAPRSSSIVRELIDGIYLYGVPKGHGLISGRMSFYRDAATLLKMLAGKHDSNVTFLNGQFSLPLVRPLKRLGPVVYYTFGSLLDELSHTFREIVDTVDLRKLAGYAAYVSIESTSIRSVDMTVVPHQRAALILAKLYRLRRDRISVSPYGQDIYERFHGDAFFSDVARFKSRFAGKKIILFVGGIEWNRKGARWMLRAFKKASKQVPSVLIMTGKPRIGAEHYLNLARELGLKVNEDILLPGMVDDRTLALLYASCDVFSLPSAHEGFSQPVIEVMAYGKPVVVSPLAAYPTVEDGDEGFVIHPNDTDSYANALQKILTDENLYAIMSKKAKLKAQQYSWDKIGFNLLRRLQQIVSNWT